jgi:hypothetical protein
MHHMLSLGALVAAGYLSVTAAAPADETPPLEATLEVLGSHVEAQTLAKMHEVVESTLRRSARCSR